MRRAEDDALAFQHPGIAPPQRLGLAPGAVQQHDAFDVFQDGALVVLDLALAVDGDDIAVGLELGDLGRAEIEYRPPAGIGDLPSQRLGKARPRQADLQQRNLVLDRRDAVANAQRQGLKAARTVRYRLRYGGAGIRLDLF